jgi:hypothetical protein
MSELQTDWIVGLDSGGETQDRTRGQAGHGGASSEASSRWICTACGEIHRGEVQPSLDPRWSIARCPACRKKTFMEREFTAADAPGDADPSSASRRTIR